LAYKESQSLTDKLCPFFKEDCHGNKCVMWHNEECVIVAFLEGMQELSMSEKSVHSSQEPTEGTGVILQREVAEAPDWLKTASPEIIAKEILEFKESKFPEVHVGVTLRSRSNFHNFLFTYWTQKGVLKNLMPSEIQVRISEAERLAEQELVKKEQIEKKERLENETEQLPNLVSQFVDWTKPRSIKRPTLTEVEQFVVDKNIDILKETKRSIFIMANEKLKTKH
jgi:hypothetical protein